MAHRKRGKGTAGCSKTTASCKVACKAWHKNSDAFGAPVALEGGNRSTLGCLTNWDVTNWEERPHGSLSLEWKSGQRKEIVSQ